jgi:hypothetical protein
VLALATPPIVAMIFAVREEMFAAASAEFSRSELSIDIPLSDDQIDHLEFNTRYESRVTNASMRSAAAASFAERMEDIRGLNEVSAKYSATAIAPIRETIKSVRSSWLSEPARQSLVRRYDRTEHARAMKLYTFPCRNEPEFVEIYQS